MGEIELYKAETAAKAKEAIAKAEKVASLNLKAKREYNMAKEQLKVYNQLAQNSDVVVSGNTGDSLLAEMLVAQRQSQIMLNVDTNSSKRFTGATRS